MSLFFKTPPGAPEPLSLAVEMCTAPRQAMRRLLDYDPGFFHWRLMGVLVVVGALSSLQMGLGFLLVGVLLSAVTTLASVYGLAGLFWLTGKPLGGAASFSDMTAAMLWPMVPLIPASVIGFFLGFMGEFMGMVDLAISLCAMSWGLVLMLFTVAEAQRFSLWHSFLNQTFAVGVVCLVAAMFLIGPLLEIYRQFQELNGIL